ncbi:HET-domain-containing protein [Polychaeton citri CBS 116435]|uniref:HET-domain-containing protein n=1 Tax=Polychaeton citri CBS 116435 TaxID=1314669 RepID=A0A9P4Q9B1_9PEZI|nr:HET-domain-containing protein [Polychaeton citri CBS 116435]
MEKRMSFVLTQAEDPIGFRNQLQESSFMMDILFPWTANLRINMNRQLQQEQYDGVNGGYELSFTISRINRTTANEKERVTFAQQLWFQSDPSTVSLAMKLQDWIRQCETHVSCANLGQSPLPDRYIDVGEHSRSDIRLCERTGTKKGRYLALSYCWGRPTSSTAYMLKTTNIDGHKNSVDADTLPSTIKDLVHVARNLHVRYVWVDAMCILQDDRLDWEQQSEKMLEIYGNAFLTVSASSAAAAAEGFLTEPHASHAFAGKVAGAPVDQAVYLTPRQVLATPLDLALPGGPFAAEPVGKRGWCVQERLLSKRILSFGSTGVILSCSEMVTSETHGQCKPEVSYLSGLRVESAAETWHKFIAVQYSGCELTRPSDRLPAIAGVARVLSNARKEAKYLAGHWDVDLPYTLLWHGSGSISKRAESWRAPSWSWASLDDSVYFLAGACSHRTHPLCVILDQEVTLRGANTFGEVIDGWIRVSAPLLRGSLKHMESRTGRKSRLRFRHGNMVIPTELWLDDPSEVIEDVFFLVIGRLSRNYVKRHCSTLWEYGSPYIGLALVQTNQSAPRFRRIGLLQGLALKLQFSQIPRKEIILV